METPDSSLSSSSTSSAPTTSSSQPESCAESQPLDPQSSSSRLSSLSAEIRPQDDPPRNRTSSYTLPHTPPNPVAHPQSRLETPIQHQHYQQQQSPLPHNPDQQDQDLPSLAQHRLKQSTHNPSLLAPAQSPTMKPSTPPIDTSLASSSSSSSSSSSTPCPKTPEFAPTESPTSPFKQLSPAPAALHIANSNFDALSPQDATSIDRINSHSDDDDTEEYLQDKTPTLSPTRPHHQQQLLLHQDDDDAIYYDDGPLVLESDFEECILEDHIAESIAELMASHLGPEAESLAHNPPFPSALDYTDVRDFAYAADNPLHYGVPPLDSNRSSAFSSAAEYSDDDDDNYNYTSYRRGDDEGEESIPLDYDEYYDKINNMARSGHHIGYESYDNDDNDQRQANPNLHQQGILIRNCICANTSTISGSDAESTTTQQHTEACIANAYATSNETYPDSYHMDGGPPWLEDPDLASPVVTMHSVGDRISREFEFSVASADEIHGRAVALFDFEPENDNEAPLRVGQVIWVSYRHGQGWLVAEDPTTGETGLVPEEYVRMLPPSQHETGRSLDSQATGESSSGKKEEEADSEGWVDEGVLEEEEEEEVTRSASRSTQTHTSSSTIPEATAEEERDDEETQVSSSKRSRASGLSSPLKNTHFS